MKLSSEEIRDQFLGFFAEKGHEIVPSGSLIPGDDPTLMFTNAGMNQFKDVFLATGTRPYNRAADTQKCLRVSGKHNDLEEVGVDTYHHTLFEMMGNWSFGDYFKKEAIGWAWELLVDRWGIDPDRLYVTVHEGDTDLGLDADNEAAELWASETSINPDHILFFGSKDNFWMMGDTGPCGPCSEIHIDLRPEVERKAIDGKTVVNSDNPMVLEIWNLVFIQYNALGNNQLEPLSAKHIDTGMGFERVTAVLQGSSSTYDTDLFDPIFAKIAELSRRPEIAGYNSIQHVNAVEKEKIRIAMRVVADHIRAISFCIADGAGPSNVGRGYVVRRILRRAVRYGYQSLGFREPFLYQLVDPLIGKMGSAFPELESSRDFIIRVVKAEEESFLRTLATGIDLFHEVTDLMASVKSADQKLEGHELHLLNRAFSHLESEGERVEAFKRDALEGVVSGAFVFLLQDTYGFPHDLTNLMAREMGLRTDEQEYEVLMDVQRNRARAATRDAFRVDHSRADDWQTVSEGDGSVFMGYEHTSLDPVFIRSVRISKHEGGHSTYEIELDRTPFYAESGGQVGDTGSILCGEQEIAVLDTQKRDGKISHIVDLLPESLESPCVARVDAERRQRIKRHHSATHLMHAALREILGPHVQQKGSMVAPDRLRFDFNHFERVTDAELREIERRVNRKVLENVPRLERRNVPIQEALEQGAMALFGEKYGERVRMITFDPSYSVELCGGTHTDSTGEIGYFRFISEGSVASGIRRVEAIAGEDAFEFIESELDELDRVRKQLHNVQEGADVEIAKIQQHTKELEKNLAELRQQVLSSSLASSLKQEMIDGVRVCSGTVHPSDMNTLRDVVQSFREKNNQNTVAIVGAADPEGGKAYLVAMVSDDLISRGIQAGRLVGQAARVIGGGGGGKPQLATAGGKNPEKLSEAVAAVPAMVRSILEG